MPIGSKKWLIPDMFWPEHTSPGVCVSHEAICLLNLGESDCSADITLYFEDREPMKLRQEHCGARRTRHIRLDRALGEDGEHIPRGTGYAALVECSVPVVVQYTRVDTTQAANSLMTTMAYPAE